MQVSLFYSKNMHGMIKKEREQHRRKYVWVLQNVAC
jgi:hypothetical protein